MTLTKWVFDKTDETTIQGLCEALGIAPLAGAALVSRGMTNGVDAGVFLHCDYPLGDALLIKDMDKGVARVREALENNERIAVFGDYDVDGIMATALMCLYLESAGGDVTPFLPERGCTGYGLAEASVDEIRESGATLIVTVDNGVSSDAAVSYALGKGIDTIICDHHKTPEKLPDAVAVIDPLREGDASLFKPLAGVGVALKFAAAIEGCDVREMLDQFGYFAAIGTVADVMPLTGENRVIVKQGLSQLAHGMNPGLAALIEETGLDEENITPGDVAFVLAPRLNAAGRMSSAFTALRLLLTDDAGEAAVLAGELNELNSRRREAEKELTAAVTAAVGEDALNQPLIVVDGYGYNSGVSGIVCSKLAERYCKPVIIIAVDENEAKGSGRSLGGFSLYDAISSCGDLLLSYGGHELAAGFTIAPDKIGEFKERILGYCAGSAAPFVCRSVHISREVAFSDIGVGPVGELALLAPFGVGNEEPVFATRSARISEIAKLGDKHCLITFEKDSAALRAALFGVAPNELTYRKGELADIAYTLNLYPPNEDNAHVSAKLRCIVPAGFSNEDYSTLESFVKLRMNEELSELERADIAPDRGDVAQVYRSIKEAPLAAADRAQTCYRFTDIAPGRVFAAIEILKELELLTVAGESAALLTVTDNPVRRELDQSGIFTYLHGAGRATETI